MSFRLGAVFAPHPVAFLLALAVLACAPIHGEETTAAPTQRFSPRDTVRGRVVDESGKPVAGVLVSDARGWLWGHESPTECDAEGNFKIGGKPGHWRHASLIASTADRSRQAYCNVHEEHALPARLEIVLKPARKVAVTVVDATDQPVAGAQVEILVSYLSAVVSETNAEGRAELLFPADGKVDWVLALKDGVGFDYYENFLAYPTTEREPLPERIELKLSGARPDVVAEAKTPDGEPVAGVQVLPWIIRKPGKLSGANVGGSRITRRSTDEQGHAHFAFLPATINEGVSFLVHSETHHSTESLFIPAGGAGPLLVTLKPNGTIRGRLTRADGSPAAQILLQGEGNGSPHYFRGFARSDEEGNYSFSLYADQTYTINVVDDDWTAPSHTGETVNMGDPPHDVNFTVIPGTLIEGTLTVGADRGPAAGVTATLGQQPQFYRWATTDERGHYRFRVGPGTYNLRFPHGMEPEQVDVKVTDQPSLAYNAHAHRKDRDTLQGIVRRADGSPAPGAIVSGESIGQFGRAGFHAAANSAGRFQTERWLDKIFIVARDVAGNQAGCAMLSEDDKHCEITVAPAATITGRVVDETGKPLPQARVQCSTHLPADLARQMADDERREPARTVNYNAHTDADGKFTVPAVPVGAKSALYVSWNDRGEGWKNFEVTEATELSAGDIVLKPRPEGPK